MSTLFICVCSLLVGASIATMLIACRLMWLARETLETANLQFKATVTAMQFKKSCKSREDLANI